MTKELPAGLAILRRHRWLVLGGLVGLCVLAWLYLLDQASGMAGMGAPPGGAAAAASWGLRDLGYLFVMWSIMMVAMMIPSATPTILLFAGMQRSRLRRSQPAGAVSRGAGVPIAAFVAGYLVIWTVYSLGAAGGQWMLHRSLLMSPAMASASSLLSGVLLVVAGAFQFSRLKDVCAGHCRSPLFFLTSEWREGTAGAFVMGIRHGSYCVGCCWALMALLFVLGVMNLVWVAALAVFVLAEKTFPGGRWITRAAGVGFLAWGVWMLLMGTIA